MPQCQVAPQRSLAEGNEEVEGIVASCNGVEQLPEFGQQQTFRYDTLPATFDLSH